MELVKRAQDWGRGLKTAGTRFRDVSYPRTWWFLPLVKGGIPCLPRTKGAADPSSSQRENWFFWGRRSAGFLPLPFPSPAHPSLVAGEGRVEAEGRDEREVSFM
jgi:hypothetical protein